MQDRPINEDATSRQVTEQRYTAFRTLDTLFTRGETALKMVSHFSQCGLRDVVRGLSNELSDTDKVSVMDLYGRTSQDATKMLERQKIGAQVIPVSGEDTCMKTLRQMQWTLEPGMQIELLTENNLVVGVRPAQFNDDSLG